MAWVVTDNMRGDKGDKGDPGSIASASAESVAASESAAVIMTGTEAVKHAHFKVPRGLPGLNAVPTDEGVGAYVAALETATRTALNASFLNYVLWDGAQYPPRVPNAVNVFLGPENPGLLMADDDRWENPGVVTLDAVVAAMRNPSSPLYAATQAVLSSENLPLQIHQGTNAIGTFGTASPNVVRAPELAKGGTNSVQLTGRIPDNWKTANFRFAWLHNVTGSAVRMQIYWSLFGDTGIASSQTQTGTYTAVAAMNLRTMGFDSLPVAGGQIFTASIVRLSDNPADDITGPIGIPSARLVRIS